MIWLQHNWRALVEIAILSVGIYYAVTFVRGTRAAPVVSGFLILLLALTLITIALDLSALRLLLRQFEKRSYVQTLYCHAIKMQK